MPKILRVVLWIAISLLGALALATIALHRGEQINAMWLVVAAVATYAVGYRFYSKFIATKLLAIDPLRATPAERLDNGRDFVPTNKWVVFGHHFAAIAGPGPLVGPVLAAQFGYLPGTLWIIAGAVLGGCVQDFVILLFSVRRDGKSLTEMAKTEIGKLGRFRGLRRGDQHHHHFAGRGGADRGERAEVEPVGDVHDRHDDADRRADGACTCGASGPGKCWRLRSCGIRASAGVDFRRAVGFADRRHGRRCSR